MAVPTIDAAITVLTESRTKVAALPAACPKPVSSTAAVIVTPVLLSFTLIGGRLFRPTGRLLFCRCVVAVYCPLPFPSAGFCRKPCERNKKKPRIMQGRADCVSLIGPAFVDGASSISAELVRQRRRANNSCGYKRRSIESSHRVASFRYFLRPFDLNWNVNIGLAVLPIQQGFTLWTL